MSGIFGIFNKTHLPILPSQFDKLAKQSSYRGPDGTSVVISDNLGLGHNSLKTTPESFSEVLPLSIESSGLSLTSDMRLDNRAELLETLKNDFRLSPAVPDSIICLKVYEKWGHRGFTKLIGDFAFVLWDEKIKTLFCVRDYFGTKPLYYIDTPNFFTFNSEIKPLLNNCTLEIRPNYETIAEYLSCEFLSQTTTLYADVMRVPPAHYISITPWKTIIHKYWSPDLSANLHYSNEDDYKEHFHELFLQSVRSRLRGTGKIAIELSGGLDSSTVLSTVKGLSASQGGIERFPAFSLSYPGKGCDESLFVKIIKDKFYSNIKIIDGSHSLYHDWDNQVERSWLPPDPPNLSNSNILVKKAQTSGAKIILTGLGGDEWFGGSRFPYFNLFKNYDIKGIVREISFGSKHIPAGMLKELSVSMCWPFLPVSVRKILFRIRNKGVPHPPWLSDNFLEKNNFLNKYKTNNPYLHCSDLSNIPFLNVLTGGYLTNVLEVFDRRQAQFKVEGRHPFLDRRVAEFAISLPESYRRRSGLSKYLLRSAGAGKLPVEILQRRRKSEYSWLFYKAFESKSFIESIENMALGKMGWISRESFLSHYSQNISCFRSNPSGPCPRSWALWYAYAINKWWNKMFNK